MRRRRRFFFLGCGVVYFWFYFLLLLVKREKFPVLSTFKFVFPFKGLLCWVVKSTTIHHNKNKIKRELSRYSAEDLPEFKELRATLDELNPVGDYFCEYSICTGIYMVIISNCHLLARIMFF